MNADNLVQEQGNTDLDHTSTHSRIKITALLQQDGQWDDGPHRAPRPPKHTFKRYRGLISHVAHNTPTHLIKPYYAKTAASGVSIYHDR